MLSATLLFFMPTLVAGMVPPYAVRLLVTENRLSGHYAGLLYFVSTLGSAAGTLITSFYLVLYLEIYQILWIMAGITTALVVLTVLSSVICRHGSCTAESPGFRRDVKTLFPYFLLRYGWPCSGW